MQHNPITKIVNELKGNKFRWRHFTASHDRLEVEVNDEKILNFLFCTVVHSETFTTIENLSISIDSQTLVFRADNIKICCIEMCLVEKGTTLWTLSTTSK